MTPTLRLTNKRLTLLRDTHGIDLYAGLSNEQAGKIDVLTAIYVVASGLTTDEARAVIDDMTPGEIGGAVIGAIKSAFLPPAGGDAAEAPSPKSE